MSWPSLKTRTYAEEMMDDFSIVDQRLGDALDHIVQVNRWLSGWRTSLDVLRPYLKAHTGATLRLLDLGTGIADHPVALVKAADALGVRLEVVAVDANPVTLGHAEAYLNQELRPDLRDRVTLEVADALALPYAAKSFDIVHAALFLHHFEGAQAAALLRSMQRIASDGIVVNDLHRNWMAYLGIKAVTKVVPTDEMFAHDAPLSVLRAFTRTELLSLAREAGLDDARIRWHWAFRWSLSTLPRTAEAR